MSWKDHALALVKRFGPAAKFASKQVLNAMLPGSPAVIELVAQALDCVHESAKEEYELRRNAAVSASPADLERLEQLLGMLSGKLAHLVSQVAAFKDTPEVASRLLNVAIATDGKVQEAVKGLYELAGRFDL